MLTVMHNKNGGRTKILAMRSFIAFNVEQAVAIPHHPRPWWTGGNRRRLAVFD